MGFKTPDLPALTAPKVTDTLLMAKSGGGTAQLTMAQAAAFFGTELVKTGNPVGTALSSKAAKSAQDTVEKTSVPTRNITLAATELPAYIASLPRLLTEYLIINVSGTLDAVLNIANFYGSGGFRIVADPAGGCTFRNIVSVSNCAAGVQLWDMRFEQAAAIDGTKSMLMAADCSRYVRVVESEFVGLNQQARAVSSSEGSRLLVEHPKIHGFNMALFVGRCSSAFVLGTEDGFYDNNYGVYVWHGGMAFLEAPDLLGGSANLEQGGLIVKSNGTLL